MVNFGPLAADIGWRVWVTPANFNGFCVLVALLHGSQVEGVSKTAALNGGATRIRQDGHHVGHWPTFLVYIRPKAAKLCIGIDRPKGKGSLFV